MEALLFTFMNEQQYDTDCAHAVIESAVESFWVTDLELSRDDVSGDYSLSVREVTDILRQIGLSNRAYWLTWELVHEGTTRFGPVIVHFDRPYGHYALAFGAVDEDKETMLLGDPARGMIIVTPIWWARRASGAAIVIDGQVRTEAFAAAMDAARSRWKRLEAVRDGR